jgi:hypothetical protein
MQEPLLIPGRLVTKPPCYPPLQKKQPAVLRGIKEGAWYDDMTEEKLADPE